MKKDRLYQPRVVKRILKNHGMVLKKSLGQNYLIDGNTVENIRLKSGVGPGDLVLEIGPGIGVLSEELAPHVDQLYLVEIDQKAVEILEETLADFKNITLVHQDILQLDLRELFEKKGKKLQVVANLPYYITSPILGYLMENRAYISNITVMVQEEVAERMVADKGGKTYGALSVFIQYFSQAEIVLRVPPTVFLPQPRVRSAVVHMKLREVDQDLDQDLFFALVKSGFNQRRKTILNSLTSGSLNLDKDLLRKVLADLNLASNLRAENLSIQDFKRITQKVGQSLQGTGTGYE